MNRHTVVDVLRKFLDAIAEYLLFLVAAFAGLAGGGLATSAIAARQQRDAAAAIPDDDAETRSMFETSAETFASVAELLRDGLLSALLLGVFVCIYRAWARPDP